MTQLHTLSPEAVIEALAFQEALIGLEKEGYHNDLIPFSQHEARIGKEVFEGFHKFYKRLQDGKKLLAEICIHEAERKKPVPDEPSKETWYHLKDVLNQIMKKEQFFLQALKHTESIQKRYSVPWILLDKGYQKALYDLHEQACHQSENLFFFLCHLNPAVFEYWLGLATCQQEGGHFEEALMSYKMALSFHVNVPLIFFQMTLCYLALDEKDLAKKSLEYCIEFAHKEHPVSPFLEKAEALKKQNLITK